MPLIKKCSVSAFKSNIAAEVDSGRDQKQAVAIAFSTLKRACGVETEDRLSPEEIVSRGKKSESSIIRLDALLSDLTE